MDKALQQVLDDLKLRVDVLEGENPVLKIQDAIRLAERNGMLYRYAQNGANWELRWSPEASPVVVFEGEAPMLICQRIIRKIPPRILPSLFPEEPGLNKYEEKHAAEHAREAGMPDEAVQALEEAPKKRRARKA